MKRCEQFFLAGMVLLTSIHRSFAPITAGNLIVFILPASAVNGGAKWQVDGGTLLNSGATNFVFAGSHTVSFTTIHGWATPASLVVSVGSGATTVTNGTYALTNTPALALQLTATNTVNLSWPSPWTNWSPQQNADLTSTNWMTPTGSMTDDGTNKSVVLNPTTGNLFFRLKL